MDAAAFEQVYGAFPWFRPGAWSAQDAAVYRSCDGPPLPGNVGPRATREMGRDFPKRWCPAPGGMRAVAQVQVPGRSGHPSWRRRRVLPPSIGTLAYRCFKSNWGVSPRVGRGPSGPLLACLQPQGPLLPEAARKDRPEGPPGLDGCPAWGVRLLVEASLLPPRPPVGRDPPGFCGGSQDCGTPCLRVAGYSGLADRRSRPG